MAVCCAGSRQALCAVIPCRVETLGDSLLRCCWVSNGSPLMLMPTPQQLCVTCSCCLHTQERITFSPHPKTLTMAGDYEYFAAQGHHPAAFALAELIDNSLRATKGNGGRPRCITVTLAVPEKERERGGGALVCVRDNGCGMSKRELNDWAVMNLSMEDRGLLQQQQEQQPQQPGGLRQAELACKDSCYGSHCSHADHACSRLSNAACVSRATQAMQERCFTAADTPLTSFGSTIVQPPALLS